MHFEKRQSTFHIYKPHKLYLKEKRKGDLYDKQNS